LSDDLIIVDASSLIVGRLSSIVAKKLIQGKKVAIVNAEKALITGTRSHTLDDRLRYLEVKGRVSARHTPKHYRRPDNVLRRTIRGMLPRRKASGLEAFKRLRVFVGVPDEYKDKTASTFDEAKFEAAGRKCITLGDLCTAIGWHDERKA
jgi:large subunit ribosomal protein L13